MKSHDNDSDDDSKGNPKKGGWAEMVRDLTATGFASAFLSEDSILSYLKEKKLPKELIAPLVEGLVKKKDEFYGVVAKEIGKVFSKIDVGAEVTKFLENHSIKIEGKVSFEPNDKKGTSIT